MKKLLVLILLLSVSHLNFAQNNRSNPVIEGRIIDRETKESLPYAILIANGPGEKKCGVTSDLDGRFKLELPAAGKYLLECRYIGYQLEIIPLIADSFKHYSFEISLCPIVYELLEITLPPHQRGGRMKTDAVSGADTVYIITGGLPDAIYRDTAKPKINSSIDSFKIYHVRKTFEDYETGSLFKSGKLYQFNDSLFYFNHGSCPKYAFYIRRGNKLLQYRGYDNNLPAEIEFQKRGEGYLIKNGKVRARVQKQ